MNDSADVAATVAATDAAKVQRIEIVGDRRRAHDAAFRARVLSDLQAPGARVQAVARRHAICTSLIYRWRRDASRIVGPSSPVRLVPVRITEPQAANRTSQESSRPALAPEPRRGGEIEIELGNGVRVHVDSDVSLAALRRVVTALRG